MPVRASMESRSGPGDTTMTTFPRPALSLVAVALLAGPVRAQGLAGPFGGGGWFLLTNKGVQEELKVSDEQAKKIESLLKDASAKAREQGQAVRDLPAEQ